LPVHIDERTNVGVFNCCCIKHRASIRDAERVVVQGGIEKAKERFKRKGHPRLNRARWLDRIMMEEW